MKKRPTPFEKPSALDQRPDFTIAPTAKTDLQRAVADIREAVATIARLGDRHATCKEVQR